MLGSKYQRVIACIILFVRDISVSDFIVCIIIFVSD